MPAPAVEVLRCPACGADVPLGQSDGDADDARDATCAHCGKAVLLPAAYRELRSLQYEDRAARRRGQALFATLDSPPWLLTRVLAAIFGGLWATWMWDDARATARGDDSAPAIGLAALIVGTLLLIVFMFRSGGSDARATEEARLRREGNGLPGWVRVAGPLGFWVLLWVLRVAIWR